MTGYVACCCRGEVYGWRVQTSTSFSLSSRIVGTRNDGGQNISESDISQTLALELEVSDIYRLVDIGSSVSGYWNRSNPFSFDNRTWLDFLDLNEDSGQTYQTGDPILRVPGRLFQPPSLTTIDWPTGSTVYDYECLGLVDPCRISSKSPSAITYPSGTEPSFENNPAATYEIFRQTNQFGQPPEETTQYRGTPFGPSSLTGIGSILGSPAFPILAIGPGDVLRRYLNENTSTDVSLSDLGLDSGPTSSGGSTPTDSTLYPEFELVIDGQAIGRQDLEDFPEEVLCLYRTGAALSLFYRQDNLNNDGFPGTISTTTVEITQSRENQILSFEYLFQ